MQHLASIVLGMLIALSAAVSAQAQAGKDRVLLLYIAVPNQSAKDNVNTWVLAFKSNIRSLLTSSTSVGGNRTINVVVKSEDVKDISHDLLEKAFGQEPTLQVLSTVGQQLDQTTTVYNQVYFGDLKGSLNDPYLSFSQEILREKYNISREALATVTLYAYAMAVEKALPSQSSRALVCFALDHANMSRKTVLQATQGDLVKLFQAISAELEARSCGGKR